MVRPGTTEFDIFSIDPATCAEKWRTHEDYPPSILHGNRGAANFDGMHIFLRKFAVVPAQAGI